MVNDIVLPPLYSLAHRPGALSGSMRKKTTVVAALITAAFRADTQEGIITLSGETCDDFSGVYKGEPYTGYFLLYPSDGSKPYTNSVSFFLDNYVPVDDNPSYTNTVSSFLTNYGRIRAEFAEKTTANSAA